MVDQSVQEYLTEYLELHPDVLDSILSKSLNAFKVFCSHAYPSSVCSIFFMLCKVNFFEEQMSVVKMSN